MPGRRSEESAAAAARVGRVLPSVEGWVPTATSVPESTAEPTHEPAADAGESPGTTVSAPERPDLVAAVRAAVAARVPPTLRGARTSPGTRGWRALLVVAILAAAVSGLVWFRSRAVPEAVPPVASTAAPAGTGAGSGTGERTPAGEIVVDVAGKVRRPGIVTLPAGSRVHEAIRAAGGLRPGATTAGLNLARRLVDGEQVVVGRPPAPTGPAPTGGATGGQVAAIDLNAATLEQLDGLPGVGPVLAQRILDYRTEHGGFRSVAQLKNVSGIGPSRYAELESKVRV